MSQDHAEKEMLSDNDPRRAELVFLKGLDKLPPIRRVRSSGSQASGIENDCFFRTRSAGSIVGDEAPRSILRTRSSGSQIADGNQLLQFFRAGSADSARARASFADLPPTVFRIDSVRRQRLTAEDAEIEDAPEATRENTAPFHRAASTESRRSSRRSSLQSSVQTRYLCCG
jgi:hypothetical protein